MTVKQPNMKTTGPWTTGLRRLQVQVLARFKNLIESCLMICVIYLAQLVAIQIIVGSFGPYPRLCLD